MALDAVTMRLLSVELSQKLEGSRIDKIYQPSKDEVVFHMRNRTAPFKLFISARSGSARVCITKEEIENPRSPPSFCMLLRKYLTGARFVSCECVPGDRIMEMKFSVMGELGDIEDISLIAELMGRYSNLVLVNRTGRIIDAMKRVDADASSVRQLLPGLEYKLPPNRTVPEFIQDTEKAVNMAFAFSLPLDRALMKTAGGIGPVVAREIARLRGTGDIPCDSFSREQKDSAISSAFKVRDYFCSPVYTTVYDADGKPSEYSFMPLTQYPGYKSRTFESLSDMLDSYYGEKDRAMRLRQRGRNLHKTVQNLVERTARRQAARKEELAGSADSEKYRIYGDLLTANLYRIKKGMVSVKVDNYYDGTQAEIPLEPRLAPNANAQKYYKEYRKKQTAAKVLKDLISKGEDELTYLQSVAYSVDIAKSEAELSAIREELQEAGYIKNPGKCAKKQKPRDFLRYISSDGLPILVGRNNIQNDRLTLKTARGRDMWFHVKGAPGSHVIVISGGEEIPLKTQNEAAALAAFHSSRSGQAKVAVDYTYVKNVHKTKDLKPGMVIYDNYSTAYVTPSPDIAEKLRDK